jgi:hypothetical protein
MQNSTLVKKYLFSSLLVLLSALASSSAIGQIIAQIGTGTQAPLTNNSIYSPICRFDATSGNDASRSNLLYTSAELNSVGILSGATISKLAFYKIGTGATTAGFSFKIYMRNSATAPPLSTTTTWADILGTHSLQYNNPAQTISASTGWVEFTLDNPFVYTGQSLEIAFDHDMSAIAGNPTTGPFDWQYTNGFETYIIGTVSTTPAGVATLSGTVANYKVRPNIQISYISSTPCSGTPLPGQAAVTPNVTCANTNVILSLTGNTPEANQTYTWQEGPAAGGPFTNISTPASSINYTWTATSTKYYRAAVSCNGGTPAYSVPVLLTVNPLFPGGTYTINNSLPTSGSNFNSFTDAFNAVNCGVAAKTIFNVSAGQTFNENPPELQASGTATDSIIFQKAGAGANPVIQPNAPGTVAASTTLGNHGDAIISINGGDYITFNGIDINTTAFSSGSDQFEYGYYLKKKSATDACKNVTIKNSVITLSKSIYSFGIHVSNNSGTGAVTVTSVGGASENIKISGNTLNNSYGGILVRGQATAAYYDLNVSIGVDSGNTVTDYAGGATVAYGIYAIGQDNLKIAKNNVTSVGSGHTTTLYGIYTGTSTNANVDIYNNTVTVTGGGTTTTIYGISSNAGGTGTNNTVRIYNNTISNCTYPTATSGTMYLIEQVASAFNLEMYGNTLTNNTLSPTTTGSFNMLYQSGAVVNQSKIYNNTISGNNKTSGTTGTTYCIYNTGASTSNNLIYNNIVDNNVVTNTSGSLYGLNLLTGSTNAVYNNKISGLTNSATTTGAVYGIAIGGGGLTNNVYNNFISDLNAPSSTNSGTSTTDLIRGISITSATALSTQNISFNTISLYASGGAIFSTSGIFHTTSATATTSTLNLRNNIIVNNSTASGVGFVSALRLSAANVLTNYGSASNNNLFHVNSGTNQVIFYDGTNSDADLNSFKARVTPRETASISENPNFVNGSVPPYNLHINTAIPTQVESGGVAVTGITDDIDGNPRNASTPDIGADEFVGVATDLTGPSISYTALGTESICIESKTISATITDASGVNVAAGTRPRLWYKKSTENDVLPATNTAASIGWKYVEASNASSPFTFTFNFSLLNTPLTFGDSISYFIVAQDLVATPNVGVSVATFNNTPATVALSSGSFPASGNIKGFRVLNQPNPIAIKIDRTELCNSGTVTLNIDNVNVSGGTYQWQRSPRGANTFTNIAGATTIPYTTATLTDSTDFRLVVSCGGTPIPTSPSPIVTVNVNNPLLVGTTPGSRCGTGSVTVSATPKAGYDVKWYAASTGGTPLFTGSSYTNTISSNTTYYAASFVGTSGTAGRQTPFAASTGFNGTDYGLVFDANQPFMLSSVDIYPTSTTAGSITVQLTTSGGTVLQTAGPFAVPAGTGTTFGGGATPFTLNVNFSVPLGTGMFLKASAHTGNIVRDNPIGTNFSYPLPIGTVGNITAGLLGGGVNANTYYYFYNLQFGAGCEGVRTAVLARVDDCPTPVTLLNFKGEKRGSFNKLDWTTVTEINNAGFELQRSTDGVGFSKLVYVNSKAPNGNSSAVINYNFDDVTPLKGYNYYRLRQVDKDGKSTLSNIVLIKGDKTNTVQVIAGYPNPVKDLLNFKVDAPQALKATLVITDAVGKVITQQQAQLTAGENKLQLPTAQLAQGTYFIKVTCDDGCQTAVHKFMKQ